jgi:hypothetical protein
VVGLQEWPVAADKEQLTQNEWQLDQQVSRADFAMLRDDALLDRVCKTMQSENFPGTRRFGCKKCPPM